MAVTLPCSGRAEGPCHRSGWLAIFPDASCGKKPQTMLFYRGHVGRHAHGPRGAFCCPGLRAGCEVGLTEVGARGDVGPPGLQAPGDHLHTVHLWGSSSISPQHSPCTRDSSGAARSKGIIITTSCCVPRAAIFLERLWS